MARLHVAEKEMTKIFILSIGLLLFLIPCLISCATPQSSRTGRAYEHGNRPSINISKLERNIHDLINRERQKQGLSPLAWNDTLSSIARKHSQDMAMRNYFSHVTPEGHDFSYRYSQAGYSCAVHGQGNIYYTGAENIFQNNLYDRVVFMDGVAHYDWNTAGQIAESTVYGWMNSQGHRKNILTPYWKSEGIGVAISPDDKVYITQNFC
ncbi:MAG TPA: CAP domain-containing protein [Nitrospirota bacterium]|nr:CAP domain-containing protein [Nitrospirota bacterium]